MYTVARPNTRSTSKVGRKWWQQAVLVQIVRGGRGLKCLWSVNSGDTGLPRTLTSYVLQLGTPVMVLVFDHALSHSIKTRWWQKICCTIDLSFIIWGFRTVSYVLLFICENLKVLNIGTKLLHNSNIRIDYDIFTINIRTFN